MLRDEREQRRCRLERCAAKKATTPVTIGEAKEEEKEKDVKMDGGLGGRRSRRGEDGDAGWGSKWLKKGPDGLAALLGGNQKPAAR